MIPALSCGAISAHRRCERVNLQHSPVGCSVPRQLPSCWAAGGYGQDTGAWVAFPREKPADRTRPRSGNASPTGRSERQNERWRSGGRSFTSANVCAFVSTRLRVPSPKTCDLPPEKAIANSRAEGKARPPPERTGREAGRDRKAAGRRQHGSRRPQGLASAGSAAVPAAPRPAGQSERSPPRRGESGTDGDGRRGAELTARPWTSPSPRGGRGLPACSAAPSPAPPPLRVVVPAARRAPRPRPEAAA